jgi:hypothetical protein
MPFVIDETRIQSLLDDCPPQSCSINICDLPTSEIGESSESPVLSSNVGTTIPQVATIISAEESRRRLLFLRNRIVQSGGLMDEAALQRQIDQIKGRV